MEAMHSGAGVLFEAVIIPHRSLSRRGLWLVVGGLWGVSAGISAGLLSIGAWPVAGVDALEILLATLLILRHARGNRASEMLLLSESGLRIVRTDVRGRRVERVLPAAWLNVTLLERPGRVPVLRLGSRGEQVEVAAALGEAEKRDLADALHRALQSWRNPVFDNPQLRDGPQLRDVPQLRDE